MCIGKDSIRFRAIVQKKNVFLTNESRSSVRWIHVTIKLIIMIEILLWSASQAERLMLNFNVTFGRSTMNCNFPPKMYFPGVNLLLKCLIWRSTLHNHFFNPTGFSSVDLKKIGLIIGFYYKSVHSSCLICLFNHMFCQRKACTSLSYTRVI